MISPHSAATSQDPPITTDPERALDTMHKYKSSENVCGASASTRMDSAKSVSAVASFQQEEDTLDNH
jgi:hypothetical protein